MSPNPYWYRHEIRVSWVAFDGRLPKCALPPKVINYHDNRPPLPKCVIRPPQRTALLCQIDDISTSPHRPSRASYHTHASKCTSSIIHRPCTLRANIRTPSLHLLWEARPLLCKPVARSLHAVDRLSQSPTRTRRPSEGRVSCRTGGWEGKGT